MYRYWEQVDLSPDGEGSGSGSGSTGAETPSPTTTTTSQSQTLDDEADDGGLGGSRNDEKIIATFQAALERAGNNAVTLAERLYRDNYQQRERNRQLAGEVTQLRNRLPEGAVVLTGDDLAAYQAYTQLGKPTDLAAALETSQRQAAELQNLQRSGLLRQVADATGYVYEVLRTLDKPELEFAVDQTDQGPVAYVTYPTGEGDTKERKPLAEYAALQWKAFMPSLQPQGAPKGTDYPAQRQDDKAVKRDVTETMIDKRYVTPLRADKKKQAQ